MASSSSLRSFVRRPTPALLLLGGGGALLWALHAMHIRVLGHPAWFSGWTLLVLMLLLTAYNLRKKLDFLPRMISSRAWLWAHLVFGYLSFLVFVLHVGPGVPDGPVEALLWLQYVGLVLTGALGHLISRRFPRLLADRGQEVLFERIPLLTRQLRERVERAVLRAAEDADSEAIPAFYREHLAAYFAGPAHVIAHLGASRRPVERLLAGLDAVAQLSGPDERELLEELREAIELKDDLDFHYAHQAVLKYWLFFHVPLAYSALVVTALHVVLVYAFGAMS